MFNVTSRRGWLRVGMVTALLSVTGLTGVAGASSTAKPKGPPPPLRIMLTNDDGWNSVGITAVHDALVAAGHDVTIVAPLTNQSGVGGRITFGGPPLAVKLEAPQTYSVGGTPADAVEVGLSSVFAGAPPDLVISGTNAGQNIGAVTVHSGTLGAAVTALNDHVPAIAVSTEINLSTGEGPYAETAAFVVRLVAATQETAKGGPLFEDGVGLNVNYPMVEGGGPPAGVELTETGRGFLDLIYTGDLPMNVGDTAGLTVGFDVNIPETVENADTTALAANKVSISPIEPDYDATRNSERKQARKIIKELCS